MKLQLLADSYAICRLDPSSPVPDWVEGEFTSISRSREELSIVCADHCVPEPIQRESDWKCFQLEGPIPFDQVGVVSRLTSILAAEQVGVFVVSTYDTDYVLVKSSDWEKAATALSTNGYQIIPPR